jgi:hypothetical protein
VCESIATQLIDNDAVRYGLLALELLTKQAFGCSPVAALLEQNVNDIVVLVDGAPQIISLATHRHEDFVQGPMVTLGWALHYNFSKICGQHYLSTIKLTWDGLIDQFTGR